MRRPISNTEKQANVPPIILSFPSSAEPNIKKGEKKESNVVLEPTMSSQIQA
jgi:hypothetical protein